MVVVAFTSFPSGASIPTVQFVLAKGVRRSCWGDCVMHALRRAKKDPRRLLVVEHRFLSIHSLPVGTSSPTIWPVDEGFNSQSTLAHCLLDTGTVRRLRGCKLIAFTQPSAVDLTHWVSASNSSNPYTTGKLSYGAVKSTSVLHPIQVSMAQPHRVSENDFGRSQILA